MAIGRYTKSYENNIKGHKPTLRNCKQKKGKERKKERRYQIKIKKKHFLNLKRKHKTKILERIINYVWN